MLNQEFVGLLFEHFRLAKPEELTARSRRNVGLPQIYISTWEELSQRIIALKIEILPLSSRSFQEKLQFERLEIMTVFKLLAFF